MYDTIIVPLDGSATAARALGPAAILAQECDSSLVIVSVVSKSAELSRAKWLYEQANTAGITDAVVNLVASDNSTASSLTEALDAYPDSLLCMSTVGRSHLGQVLGSVAESLLETRAGHILLIGPHCEPNSFKPRGKILVPTDGSQTAGDILAIASAWAKAFQMNPEVVAVLDPDLEAAAGPGPVNVATEAAVPSRAARSIEAEIGRPVDWDVLHGDDPAKAIVSRAEEIGAALIAMSTHGRSGLRRVVMGSVSMTVAHKATCPVLVSRPLQLRGSDSQ